MDNVAITFRVINGSPRYIGVARTLEEAKRNVEGMRPGGTWSDSEEGWRYAQIEEGNARFYLITIENL